MNLKSILYFTVLFVIRVNGLLQVQNSSLSRQVTDKCDLTARPQCSSDCSKILACVSKVETPIFSINCNGSTPYCDNGHCVATPGNCSIKTQNSSILCTSAGVFPEPTDCSQSHSCSEVGSQSIVSKCPNGRIFDSKSKLCVPRSVNNQRICRKISCNNVKNDFLVFPANPAFYAYCFTSATGVHHTYMYKCDDEINKVFDVDTKKCRFNCKSRGYYSDPFDCSSYYICNGLKFASRHVHCPPNYFFNGTVCLNSMAHCPVGSILNMTSSTPIPIANMSLAADEISHTSEPMTEEVTDATTLSFSESTVIETSTTYELTTMHTVPMTMQTVDSQMATPTRKPSGAIWKHMGLLSVRVGRFLNII